MEGAVICSMLAQATILSAPAAQWSRQDLLTSAQPAWHEPHPVADAAQALAGADLCPAPLCLLSRRPGLLPELHASSLNVEESLPQITAKVLRLFQLGFLELWWESHVGQFLNLLKWQSKTRSKEIKHACPDYKLQLENPGTRVVLERSVKEEYADRFGVHSRSCN